MRRGIFAMAAFAIFSGLAFVHPFGDPRAVMPQGRDTLLRAPGVSPDVRAVLINKCADCHSAETQWPLYSRIPPGSWLIERDIVVARRNMDLSHWADLSTDDQALVRAKISEQAKRGTMPPTQYRALHPDAKLTSADIDTLTLWARGPTSTAEVSFAPADAARGKLVFEKRCAGCHSMDTSAGKEGPKLAGVFGRQAGTVPHFAYSNGLKSSGVIWNDATLDQWLSGPDTLVPDNNMDFRVARPDERRDLIAFLKH